MKKTPCMFLLFPLSSFSRFCHFSLFQVPGILTVSHFPRFLLFLIFLEFFHQVTRNAYSCLFQSLFSSQTETQSRAVDVTMEDTSLPSLIPTSTSTTIPSQPAQPLPNQPQVFTLSCSIRQNCKRRCQIST